MALTFPRRTPGCFERVFARVFLVDCCSEDTTSSCAGCTRVRTASAAAVRLRRRHAAHAGLDSAAGGARKAGRDSRRFAASSPSSYDSSSLQWASLRSVAKESGQIKGAAERRWISDSEAAAKNVRLKLRKDCPECFDGDSRNMLKFRPRSPGGEDLIRAPAGDLGSVRS